MTSPPSSDILIAPLGKQPMPVLLPILEYAPAQTFLIPTVEVRDIAEAIRRVAKQAGRRVIVLGDVDPYDAEATYARCCEVMERPDLAGRRVAINISGGTTVMAMGAQRAARELRLPMVYINTETITMDDRHLNAAPYQPRNRFYAPEAISFAHDGTRNGVSALTTTLSLEQYIAAHGARIGVDEWSTGWTEGSHSWGNSLGREPRFLAAARSLGAAETNSVGLLKIIRKALQNKGALEGHIDLPEDVSDETHRLLDLLLAYGLIRPDGAAYQVVFDDPTLGKYVRKFLEGVWLEIFIADACGTSGHFDDVRSGVKIYRDEDGKRKIGNEIDVIVMTRGRMAAISCKTGNEINQNDTEGKLSIYELDALLQTDLMGLYARKVLVTQQSREDINTTLSNRAYYSQTSLITGHRLVDVARIIREHIDKPQLNV